MARQLAGKIGERGHPAVLHYKLWLTSTMAGEVCNLGANAVVFVCECWAAHLSTLRLLDGLQRA